MFHFYGDIDLRVDGPVETMARVESVLDWVEAMTKQEAEFYLLDCFVSTDEKNRFGVIIAGQVLTQNLNDLRAAFESVLEDLLRIPTDTMKIQADIFERELFISLV